MSSQRFFSLVAAAIVVLVVALSLAKPRHDGGSGAGVPVLPQLAMQFADVTQVTLRHGAASPQVTLRRGDHGWTLDQRAGFAADSAKLRALLVTLAGLRVAEEKTADPANYASLGVDDPGHPGASGTEVIITTTQGSRSLIIGKPAAGGNFVRDPHQARSVLAIPRATPDAEPRDWIDARILDLKPAGIRAVSIRAPAGPAVTHPGSAYDALAGLEAADVAASADIDWKSASVATVTMVDGTTLLLTGAVAGERHWLMLSSAPGRAFELAASRYDAIFRP